MHKMQQEVNLIPQSPCCQRVRHSELNEMLEGVDFGRVQIAVFNWRATNSKNTLYPV